MSLNEEQLILMKEWWKAHSEFKEKIIWIGCNPSDPEMFKQQADDGFKLMREFSKYTRDMLKKIDDAKEETPEDKFRFLLNKSSIKSMKRDLEIIKTGKLPESPEDRFRAFLTPKIKTNDLVIFKPNGSKKIIKGDPVDKILDQAGLTNAEKLEFRFEKDFPGKKALANNKITQFFREWLNHRGLYVDYFKYGDYKNGNSS